MKVRGKILSLLGLISISFSAAAEVNNAFCPSVEELNKIPGAFIKNNRVLVPGGLGLVKVDLAVDGSLESYSAFLSATLSFSTLRCNYLGRVSSNFPLVILLSAGPWKPALRSRFLNDFCDEENRPLLCGVVLNEE